MSVESNEMELKSLSGRASREVLENALAHAVECARARYIAADTPQSRAEAERSLREALARLWDQMLSGPSGHPRTAPAESAQPA